MPSFRITLTVGALRPGVHPASVLPLAAATAAALTTVEASDLTVVADTPRLTVRYTADDPASAARIGQAVLATATGLAAVIRSTLTQRVGGRWMPPSSH